MNGTVRIEKWTVTRSGKSTKITGPVTTQEKREILRRQAARHAQRAVERSELRFVPEAVPGAAVTVVRLHAPLSVLEQRIRLREPSTPETEIEGARWWAEHLENARLEDHLVETHDRPVGEIAREVLRLASWLT